MSPQLPVCEHGNSRCYECRTVTTKLAAELSTLRESLAAAEAERNRWRKEAELAQTISAERRDKLADERAAHEETRRELGRLREQVKEMDSCAWDDARRIEAANAARVQAEAALSRARALLKRIHDRFGDPHPGMTEFVPCDDCVLMTEVRSLMRPDPANTPKEPA